MTDRTELTRAERAVLDELLRDGATNKRIARRLGCSERTVKHHMSVIFAKLGVTNRGELILALNSGPVSVFDGSASQAGQNQSCLKRELMQVLQEHGYRIAARTMRDGDLYNWEIEAVMGRDDYLVIRQVRLSDVQITQADPGEDRTVTIGDSPPGERPCALIGPPNK